MKVLVTVLLIIGCMIACMMYCLAAVSSRYSKYEEEEMGPEKEFENKIKAFLKEQGCWFIKYWGGGGYTKAGIPDLLICCSGKFVAVEVKAATGNPSDLQRKTIRDIRAAGGVAFTLYPDQFEEFKHMIINMKEGRTCSLQNRQESM